MNLLRTRFFVAFVSLSLLIGFTHETFADCHRPDEQVQQSQTGGPLPTDADDCDCACHQLTPAVITAALQVGDAKFQSISFIDGFEFSPDAVPQSIDHPPQLS